MWAQIGVTASISVVDPTALSTAYNNVSYPDGIIWPYAVTQPFTCFNIGRYDVGGATYKQGESVDFTTRFWSMVGTPDLTQRTALVKQFALDFMNDVAVIPFTNANVLNCIWPWVKNYYGETEGGHYDQMPMIKLMWIDQNLKKSMGK